MEKNFWQSKTMWAALIVAIAGALQALGYSEISQPLFALGGALGFVGLRTAMK